MEELLARVRATGLLAGPGPVLVLLSGGRDSTCLLDVALLLRGPEAVRALHVDFGLREDAAADAEHCRALAGRFGVELEVERVRRVGADRSGRNLQAWARETRYDLARRRLRALGPDAVVATGHTASDQAETVLYRLASSPSRRALLGMPERRGPLVRPLLRLTRDETTAWCASRGLTWREDASNASPRFARARVRDGLLPALRAVHPAAEANVVAAAALLRDEAAVLDGAVDEVLAGRDAVPLAELRALPPALARLCVVRLAEDEAGALVPRAGGRAADVLALGDEAALSIGDGVRARTRAGVLRFEAEPARGARADR